MVENKSDCEKLELLSSTALEQGVNPCSNKTTDVIADNNSKTDTIELNNSSHVFAAGANSPLPVSSESDSEQVHINDDRNDNAAISGIKNSSFTNSTDGRKSDIPIFVAPHLSTSSSSSSYPTSPCPQYGENSLVDSREFSSVPPYQYHHPNQINHHPNYHHTTPGNIVRTLSEASLVYGSNPMLVSSHTANVPTALSNVHNSEYDTTTYHATSASQLPQQVIQHRHHRHHQQPSYEEMTQRLRSMQDQLHEKNIVVSSLQHRVNYLEGQIHELRQLPTGKISHIPVDDMLQLMAIYGSETSNQTLPQQRKNTIKKASIVRQFRRWNPEFFRYFLHVNGEWVPKLGKEGEMQRRAEKRRMLQIAKQQSQQQQRK